MSTPSQPGQHDESLHPRSGDGKFSVKNMPEAVAVHLENSTLGKQPFFDDAGTPIVRSDFGDLKAGERFVDTDDYGQPVIRTIARTGSADHGDRSFLDTNGEWVVEAETEQVRRVGTYAVLPSELRKGDWIYDGDYEEVRKIESVDGDNKSTGIEFEGYDENEVANGEPERDYFMVDVPNDVVYNRGCPRHGGVWGDDETCSACCTSEGVPRDPAQTGPLGPGATV